MTSRGSSNFLFHPNPFPTNCYRFYTSTLHSLFGLFHELPSSNTPSFYAGATRLLYRVCFCRISHAIFREREGDGSIIKHHTVRTLYVCET